MTNPEWTHTDRAVARDILRYLMDRPQARDSVQFIATWWVRRQRLEEAVASVQRVMERLAEDALVLEYEDPHGYGINTRRIDYVLDFLATAEPFRES